jgi:hypothetical protein
MTCTPMNNRCRATAGNRGRVAALARALGEIEQTIAQLADESRSPVPRIPELRRLMDQLCGQASSVRAPIEGVMRACAR